MQFLWRLLSLQQILVYSGNSMINSFIHDGDRYHIETSPLTCSANQWTGFYMITVSIMKEVKTLPQVFLGQP